MIEITLTDTGGFGGCTDFIHSLDSAEDILIEDCCRCIGVVLFWKRKADCPKHIITTLYAVSAFHIPPYSGDAKNSRKQFFKILNDFKEWFDLQTVSYCGGKINTEINRMHYERSKNFFINPIQYLFPQASISRIELLPMQHSATMYMNEFLEITVERREYATES